MNDIEARLRALGDQAREEVMGMSGPKGSNLRRIRVRRASLATAAVACIAALSAGAMSLGNVLDTPEMKPAGTPTVDASPERSEEARTGRPIWPEGSFDAAREDCNDGVPGGVRRSRPKGVAGEFAHEVLGWDAAAAQGWVEQAPGDTRVLVTRLTPHRGDEIEVYTAEAAPGCWVVTGVSRPDQGQHLTAPSFSLSERTVGIGFEPHGAVSATVQVTSQGEAVSAEWDGGPPKVDVQVPFWAARTQHYLILFKHADGDVMGAEGAGFYPASNLQL